MQSFPRADVPVAIADGAVEVRVKDVEGLMVGFVRLPAGADLRPATKALPTTSALPASGLHAEGHGADAHDRRPSGLRRGRGVLLGPGPRPRGLEDCEYVEFSPSTEFQHVLDHLTGVPAHP